MDPYSNSETATVWKKAKVDLLILKNLAVNSYDYTKSKDLS